MSSKKNRKVNWTRFIPGLDCLEARETPAGNITASLVNGVLVIRGTADVDSFRISGTGENSAVIRPLDGSTLNGGAAGKYFGGFRGIDVQTFGANDQVIVENVNVSDFLSVDTGDGIDVVHIVGGTRSQDSTWIRTGAGDDRVFIKDSRFEDHFAIDTGDGNDRVSIERSRFTGRQLFNGGAGNSDGLGITASRFEKKTSIGFEANFNVALPIGLDDTATVSGAGTATVNVLANDVAVQGTFDPATVTVTRQPSFGTAKVNTDGTITYTRTADGSGSDFFQYVAKNTGGAFTNETFVRIGLSGSIDTTAPTVTLSTTAANPTNVTPVEFKAVFSESVTGFNKTNISVANGKITNEVAGSGTTYTFSITPTGDGTVSATILANAAKDSAGNSSKESTTVSTVFDSTGPVVTVNKLTTNDTTPTVTGTVDAGTSTVTVTANGQTATGTITGTTFTATFGPTLFTEGTFDLVVTGKDALGNSGTATSTGGLVIDLTVPVATLTSSAPEPTTTNPIPFTVTFTETVTGFELSDLTLTNGTASGLIPSSDGKTYTFSITALTNGAVTAKVNADAASDAAGNKSAVTAVVTRTISGLAPSVTLASDSKDPTNLTAIPVTVTFSSAVTGFEIGDLTLVNATASNFVANANGTTYTFDLNPTNQGTASASIAAGKATDSASVGNTASAVFSRVFDTTAPVATLTSTASDPTGTNPIPFNVSFNEVVTGFVIGDLTITNGTAGNFLASADGKTYSFSVTATSNGPVTAKVNADAATDTAGNKSAATAAVSRTFSGSAPGVTLTSDATDPTNLTAIPVTVTFTNAVTGFVEGDLTLINATTSNFVAVAGGTTYTFNLIPTAEGTASASVAAGKATDSFGKDNTASLVFSRVFDSTAPVASVTTTAPDPTGTSPIPFTVTFTETVTGFDLTDLTLTNGTAGNLVPSANGKTYTFGITPTNTGAVSVLVNANAATDAAGNKNAATAATSITFTSPAPSVTLASTAKDPTNKSPITVTATFSAAVTGFELGDLTLVNATASNLLAANGGKEYTFDLTPVGQGTVSVSVGAGKAVNEFNVDNTASTVLSRVFDSDGSTGTIDSLFTNDTTPTITGTIANPADASISVSAGGQTVTATITGTNWTATLTTPLADNTYTIVAVFSDTAGNQVPIQNPGGLVIETTQPTVQISSSATSPTSLSKIPVDVIFQRGVVNFDQTDIVITNGTISNFQIVDEQNYSFDVLPTGDGTVTINIAADVAQDLAGNNNQAATQFSIISDITAPSITIASTATNPTSTSMVPVTVTFSENVIGFVEGDITISGGTLVNFQTVNEKTFTFDVTTTGNVTVTVDIAAGVAKDGVGKDNLAATQFSIVVDLAPTVTVTTTSTSPTNAADIPFTVTFNEAVTGFEIGDLTVVNGTAVNFVANADNKTYTFDVQPTIDGDVTVSVAAGVAKDSATNDNNAAAGVTVVSDRTGPTVTVTSASASPTNAATIPYTVTFDTAVTDFVIGDITIVNGTASNFVASVDNKTYTFDVTPGADGDVIVSVAAGVATDAVTNGNTAGAPVTVVSDTTAPTAMITSNTASPTTAGGFTVTVTFSEDVSNFVLGDVVVGNGTATNFSIVDDKTYRFDVTADADGVVTIDFAAGIATDDAGNGNVIPAGLSITVDRLAPTGTIAADSLSGTATDATTSVSLVEVSIFNGTNYFDGLGFNSATEVFLTATGTTAWSYAFTTAGTYTVNARLTDIVGNVTTIQGTVTIV